VHRVQSIWVSQVGYWDLKSRAADANYLKVSGTACDAAVCSRHTCTLLRTNMLTGVRFGLPWSCLRVLGVFPKALRAQQDAEPLCAFLQTMQEALDRGIQKLVIITVPTAVRTLQRLVPMQTVRVHRTTDDLGKSAA
jgi:hypothetical protein